MTENIIQNQNLSSIKVSKGMAGKFAFDIKIYYKDTDNYEEVIAKLEQINKKLNEKFKE